MLRSLSRAYCTLASEPARPEARRAVRAVERPGGARARAAPGRLADRPPRRHPPHAPEGQTMILNRRTDRPRPRQVYIGRPSKWGNRFRLHHEGNGSASSPSTARTSSTGFAPAG